MLSGAHLTCQPLSCVTGEDSGTERLSADRGLHLQCVRAECDGGDHVSGAQLQGDLELLPGVSAGHSGHHHHAVHHLCAKGRCSQTLSPHSTSWVPLQLVHNAPSFCQRHMSPNSIPWPPPST